MVAASRPPIVAVIMHSRSTRKARYDLKPLLVHVRPRGNQLVTRWTVAGCDRNRTHGAVASTGRRAVRAARRPGPLLWGVAAPAVALAANGAGRAVTSSPSTSPLTWSSSL